MTADMDEKQPLVGDPEKGKHDGGPGSSVHLLLQQYKIPLIILYYGLCSSTLIVINKVAVHNITVSQAHVLSGPSCAWGCLAASCCFSLLCVCVHISLTNPPSIAVGCMLMPAPA